MQVPFSWRLGLRYTGIQSGNPLLWFLSRMAITGLILSVALLVVVLSVMNGFDRELRLHILSIVPHVTLYYEHDRKNASELPLSPQQWQDVEDQLKTHPAIQGVIPFVEREALLKSGVTAEPLIVYGMEEYPPLVHYLDVAAWQRWREDERAIFLSAYLARRLMVAPGDEVMAIFPPQQQQASAMQLEVFRVAGIFDTKTELDKAFVWVHLGTLQKVSGLDYPQGFRLSLKDLFASREVAWEVLGQLPSGFYGQDWSQTHGNLYDAVQMSRAMVSLLMFIIIAVAVFNVVSTLMLVVMEKKQAIAILQVMGADARQIIGVFVMQGMLIGLLGSVVGALIGSVISLWLPDVISLLEQWFHFQLLSTEIYPVSYIPSDLRFGQVVWVVFVSVTLSLMASCYPAWRGAQTIPAKVLRYE
jgi:lipoprotein-releasing system permease protein